MGVAKYVHRGILTPAQIGSRSSGWAFLEMLVEAAAEWAPEKYNYVEPVNRPFDPANLEEALNAWRFDCFWRRRQPAVQGSARCGGKSTARSTSMLRGERLR